MPERSPEISPNFTDQKAKFAEEQLGVLAELGKPLGVEILSLEQGEDEITEAVKTGLPERYDLVTKKLSEEGLDLSNLPKDVLVDRLLGVDSLFRFNGKIYAIDVASGKHSTIINKERKMQAMEDIYKQLGIDRALILRLGEKVTEDVVLDLFTRLEKLGDQDQDIFTLVVKYPETNMKKRKGHL